MGHGKTIRIFLADGSASGIRHAEVVNWTGQAIVCPRGRIGELQEWEESQRPGVYMLHGDDPEGSRPMVYIGEAENVHDRLKSHVKDPKKEFFDRVVLFTSKDANLTKAHVKYLESRMVEIAREVDRVTLANSNTPPRPSLPRADAHAMEEFLGPARMLLSALGFSALQALAKKEGKDDVGSSGPLSGIELSLVVKKRHAQARGFSTDEGFVVTAGSLGSFDTLPTLSKGWHAERDELIADGAIAVEGAQIRFTRDVLFSSPSAAASIVVGGTRNGRISWKASGGRTLKDLEEALLDAAAGSEGESRE